MRSLRSLVAVLVLGAALAPSAHADWRRYDDDWRWHRPHPHYYGPREVILVYPPPPAVVYARPAPQVVYAEPAPVQAMPTSPPYTDGNGRYCREYQSTVTVGGTQQPSYGTACLQPDGTWRIVR